MKNCTGYTIINGERQILYTAGPHRLSAHSYQRLQVTNILTFYKEEQPKVQVQRKWERKRETRNLGNYRWFCGTSFQQSQYFTSQFVGINLTYVFPHSSSEHSHIKDALLYRINKTIFLICIFVLFLKSKYLDCTRLFQRIWYILKYAV